MDKVTGELRGEGALQKTGGRRKREFEHGGLDQVRERVQGVKKFLWEGHRPTTGGIASSGKREGADQKRATKTKPFSQMMGEGER